MLSIVGGDNGPIFSSRADTLIQFLRRPIWPDTHSTHIPLSHCNLLECLVTSGHIVLSSDNIILPFYGVQSYAGIGSCSNDPLADGESRCPTLLNTSTRCMVNSPRLALESRIRLYPSLTTTKKLVSGPKELSRARDPVMWGTWREV
jgi:hypothetical protein